MSCAPCQKRKEKLQEFYQDSKDWFQESKLNDAKTLLAAGALFVSIVALFKRLK